MLKYKHLFAVIYGVLLTAFTVYVVLDTFVITRVYAAVPEEETAVSETVTQSEESAELQTDTGSGRKGKKDSQEETSDETQDNISTAVTATSYEDENISVTITEYEQNNTVIHVADVQVSSADYLQTALAKNAYGKNVTQTTSAMATANSAILAVNGDYYGARESGYVLRNGVLYRSTAAKGQEDLVIYADGSFEIINESDVTAEELLANGAVQILSFGPGLVVDGEVSVDTDDEVGKAKASNPRTAIGVIDDLHYVFVVSDGRTDESEGLSLYELAVFMKSLGVETAYNLDGGGSSTMIFNGELINNPTSTGNSIKERSVSDIVYIGY